MGGWAKAAIKDLHELGHLLVLSVGQPSVRLGGTSPRLLKHGLGRSIANVEGASRALRDKGGVGRLAREVDWSSLLGQDRHIDDSTLRGRVLSDVEFDLRCNGRDCVGLRCELLEITNG